MIAVRLMALGDCSRARRVADPVRPVPPTRVMGSVVMFRYVKRSGVRYDEVDVSGKMKLELSHPVTRLAD